MFGSDPREPKPQRPRAVTMADVAYREGDIGIVTLLDALRTSARSQSRDIDMQLEARLAQVALERALGGVLWP